MHYRLKFLFYEVYMPKFEHKFTVKIMCFKWCAELSTMDSGTTIALPMTAIVEIAVIAPRSPYLRVVICSIQNFCKPISHPKTLCNTTISVYLINLT